MTLFDQMPRPAHQKQQFESVHPTCPRCKLKLMWKGFHVCFDASKKDPSLAELNKRSRNASSMTMAERASIRWQRYYEANQSRDARIIEDYEERNVTTRALAEKYGIAYQTVLKILHEAGVEMNSNNYRKSA